MPYISGLALHKFGVLDRFKNALKINGDAYLLEAGALRDIVDATARNHRITATPELHDKVQKAVNALPAGAGQSELIEAIGNAMEIEVHEPK